MDPRSTLHRFFAVKDPAGASDKGQGASGKGQGASDKGMDTKGQGAFDKGQDASDKGTKGQGAGDEALQQHGPTAVVGRAVGRWGAEARQRMDERINAQLAGRKVLKHIVHHLQPRKQLNHMPPLLAR